MVKSSKLGMNDRKNFILKDNPGFNEFGTEQISKMVNIARAVSSGLVFITTFDTYKNLESSHILKMIYEQNKGNLSFINNIMLLIVVYIFSDIMKFKRLTIVINKMDSAMQDSYDEESLTKDEIIQNVRSFLSSKVFQCQDKDIPDDCIILVCGKWAYYSRLLSKYPADDKLVENVEQEAQSLLSVVKMNSEEKKEIKEMSTEDKAKELEIHSNMDFLERR